ncbi:MAG: hypothetical protein ACREAZ_03700 [Nitrososphaera sp.]
MMILIYCSCACDNAITAGSTRIASVIVQQWLDMNASAPPSLPTHFDSISFVHSSFTASTYVPKNAQVH